MHEPFAPQLALFIASPDLLALYREFVFPLVPTRTGLQPVGIDEIKVSHTENTPLAIDIALSRAAVVVYDSGGRGRLRLEYIHARRSDAGARVIEVAAPSRAGNEPATEGRDENVQTELRRSSGMSGWSAAFVDPLLARVSGAVAVPSPTAIGRKLTELSEAGQHDDLLLTSLALLEHLVRRQELVTAGAPPGVATPRETSVGMARLAEHFTAVEDYNLVVDALSLRHALLQGPLTDLANLETVALKTRRPSPQAMGRAAPSRGRPTKRPSQLTVLNHTTRPRRNDCP